MAAARASAGKGAHICSQALPWLIALGFVAIGLSVSLVRSPLGDLGVEADFFAELAPAAQQLANGHLAVNNYPFKGPLHSFVLVPVHAALSPFGVGWYRSAVVVSLLAGALTLLLVYRIAFKLAGRRAALVTMLLTGAVKVYFIHAHKASSDQLFVLMVAGAAAVLLTATPRRATWMLCGALGGMAYLTRYLGIVVPMWGLLALLLIDPDRLPWRQRATAGAWLLAGFVLVAAPWSVLTHQQTGSWSTSRNLQNIVDEFYGGERAAAIPPSGFASLGAVVAHDPAHFARHFFGNLPRHLVGDVNQISGRVFGVVALLALGGLWWRRPNRRQAAFLSLFILMFVALCGVFYLPRFSLVLIPGWALLVALGIERLPRGRNAVALVVVAGLVIVHVGHIRRALDFYDGQQPRHLMAAIDGLRGLGAHWTDEKLPMVMARKGHLAHYADMAYTPYPGSVMNPDELLDKAAARGVDFLVVGVLERNMLKEPEALDHLDRIRDGVEIVWRDRDTLIYRLRPVAAGGS